ncbi:amino acid adenylation domain-containing protein [Scytonema tolypothrichoides VB-61278]|nr:amino acid adenylation domain-containing protein [Scytonema tolypothrichoides VB-61278]
MNLVEFLQNLSAIGIELWVNGDKLCYEAPEDVLSPELLAQIKQYKQEIIYLLQKRTNIAKTDPLSHRQTAVWFLYQLAPLSAAYNLAYAARLVSNVDIAALRQATQALIERHSVLRTTYTAQHGEPVQTIQENQEVCFSIQEAANWSQDDLSNWLVSESDRPFDLNNGPVLRFNLLIKNTITDASVAKEVILLMSAHHIAMDFWSLELLVSELRLFYKAIKTGQQIALPPQNLQYKDFVRWENQMLASQEGERLWNYWRDRLAGELPILNLPTDRPRPPVQTYEGASYSFVFGEKLIHNLLEVAKAEGVTLYTIILAAFQVLLLRYTNQEDILIGCPMAGRSLAEFEKIVGFFANPVVCRADLSGNPTFRDLLSRVRSCLLGALEHQDYPYALLVERLRPLRDSSRSPLDQVALVWDRTHQSEGQVSLMDSDGLIVESITPESKGSPFDLSLTIVDITGSLKGIWTYNTDLFDGSTIERMAGHFQTLLEGIVANPHQQIWQLPLLRENERQQLLVEWNDTQKDYPQDKCIHQWFEEQVERTPDAVAVVFQNQQLTYGELNDRANQLAHYLQTFGVGPEVLVGICVERSLEMVVGLLGILKAGGAYVPLDPTYPSERLGYMLQDALVQVLLTKAQLVESLPKHNARVVCLDTSARAIALLSESNPISGVTSDNLAYVIYTSGSTGKPKGAMNTHLGICNRLLWMQETYQLTAADCVLQKTPFSFDVSVWELFWPLLTGARLVVAKPGGHQDSAYLVNLILEQQITTLHFVPSMLQVFLEEQGLESCSCLKRTFCSGEELPKKLEERFFARLGCELHNLYGPTEAAIDVTFWQCKPESNRQKVPIGRPIANTQIYILNPDLQPVPIGVPGELHISGAGLALGYLNRPETTAEKFIPNPFSSEPGSRLYRTGDLARYLADGNIEYLGRRDYQVKIRGFRIELGEIQAALTQYPDVNTCVAIVREDTSGDKRLVAYVVVDTHIAVTKSELRSFLKTKLPEYMIPAAFVILESLPLTPNGKLDRRALPAPDTNRLAVETSFVPPLDIVEQQLAEIWAEVLSVYPVGVRENFFDLGGHSLLAVQLMARIEQQFKKNLPLATLFQNSTIERLATILRQPIDDLDWSALVPIQPNGSKPPFFCVPGAEGNTTYLYNLAHHLGKQQPFYGLQPLGLDGESKPHRRIEDMAAYYIEAIQSIQPSGPYFLGGHSFGGMVAFEMATQLHQQGYEVALLALLDSSAPGYRTNKLDFDGDDAGWLNMIASIYENIYGKSLNVSEETLKVLAPDEQLNYFKQQLQMVNLLPPDVGIKQVRGMMQVFKTNFQTACVYMPQAIYPAQITFFKASQIDVVNHAYSEILDELGLDWDKFSAQPLDIHFVPGNHNTMLNEPHVQVLAKQLTICIERSQANG